MNENKNAHKDIATTPRPQMAASGRLDFISFRIAQKSYTIYKMSPRTTARIMAARHIGIVLLHYPLIQQFLAQPPLFHSLDVGRRVYVTTEI